MSKTEHIRKSHNVSCLLYHFVSPIKNRRKVLKDEKRENDLKEICKEIEENYEIYFLEIGSDIDHVHFLIQSVPELSTKTIITTIREYVRKQGLEKSYKKIAEGQLMIF